MRWTAALVVVLVMGTVAGCAGIGDDDERSTPSPASPTETPDGSAESVADPDEEVDGEQLAVSHGETVRDSGSFTVTSTLSIESDGERTTLHTETQVDLDAETAYERVDAHGQSVTERYTTPETTYVRTEIDDHETIDRAEEPFDGEIEPVDGEDALYEDTIEQVFGGEVDLTEEGTTTHDGDEVTVFEAEGVETWNPPEYDPEEVTDFEVQVFVDADGIVRLLSYEITEEYDDGERMTISMTIEIENVGETTVETPEWTQAATE